MDDDIGWNDFELRNYDPQIGRWVQMDPYDEFPSPYTGMGDDPINNIDPSGGFLGLSSLVSSAVRVLGGAIIGAAVDVSTGGDGWNGLMIGATAGLLSSLGGVGRSIASGVVSTGNLIVNAINGLPTSNGNANPYSSNSGPGPKPRIIIKTVIRIWDNDLPEGEVREYGGDVLKGIQKVKVGSIVADEGEDGGDIITYTDYYLGHMSNGAEFRKTTLMTKFQKAANRVTELTIPLPKADPIWNFPSGTDPTRTGPKDPIDKPGTIPMKWRWLIKP